MKRKINRTANIREVDNGFVVTLSPMASTGFSIATGEGEYESKELIVSTVPKLMKMMKAYFVPQLVDAIKDREEVEDEELKETDGLNIPHRSAIGGPDREDD